MTGSIGNDNTRGDNLNDNTVKVGQNTVKNPEDL